MRNKIENLGDYNVARIMLQNKNGDLSALITEFKQIGANEALPKQLCVGAFIGVSVLLLGQYSAKKVASYVEKCKAEKELENMAMDDVENDSEGCHAD